MSLATVTAEHVKRAETLIACGLDVEQVSQMLATHDADRAIVERYPKTVDGVTVMPSMDLWILDDSRQPIRVMVTSIITSRRVQCAFHGKDSVITASDAYGTRQAAEKAKPA